MAIIDKKQKRWYAKSTFDSLDKTTIPVGTEIQVGGEIEETDLTADLQTKINGKLTAPTTPTADSAVTLLADGTTGTKALSEFSEKIYKHTLNISGSSMTYILMFFSPNSTAITTTTLINDNGSWITGATGRNLTTNSGCICVGYAPLEALMISDNGNLVQFNYSSMTNITDSVVEL